MGAPVRVAGQPPAMWRRSDACTDFPRVQCRRHWAANQAQELHRTCRSVGVPPLLDVEGKTTDPPPQEPCGALPLAVPDWLGVGKANKMTKFLNGIANSERNWQGWKAKKMVPITSQFVWRGGQMRQVVKGFLHRTAKQTHIMGSQEKLVQRQCSAARNSGGDTKARGEEARTRSPPEGTWHIGWEGSGKECITGAGGPGTTNLRISACHIRITNT